MTKDEALKMCLEYIETDAHERKYVRHAIKEANQELLEALELIVQKHQAQESIDGAISVAMAYISKHRGQA